MLPTVLASECVVEREARLKEALPTALCLAICLTRGWEGLKDVVPPSPQRTPCWELEWGPAYILTHHPGPLKTILHLFLPFRDGCCRQGECFSHSEQGRRWQPAGHPCWGVQESLNARPGAYKLVLWNCKGFIRLALTHGYWGEGSGFNWRLARIVVWREDCIGKCRSYFGRESLNPLTMKILCW